MMDTINERLAKLLLIDKQLNTSEIGLKIGSTYQSVDGWLKGKGGKYVMPAADVIPKLCEAYNLDPVFVLFGTNKIEDTNIIISNMDHQREIELLEREIKALKNDIKNLESHVRRLEGSEAMEALKETVKAKDDLLKCYTGNWPKGVPVELTDKKKH